MRRIICATDRLDGHLPNADRAVHCVVRAHLAYCDHSQYDAPDYSWTEFYPDATEEMPDHMPKPLGRAARITCFVDADYAHDVVTRRSVTGTLLLVNNMPVAWVSKRQKTVETSTYGSELVAARLATFEPWTTPLICTVLIRTILIGDRFG